MFAARGFISNPWPCDSSHPHHSRTAVESFAQTHARRRIAALPSAFSYTAGRTAVGRSSLEVVWTRLPITTPSKVRPNWIALISARIDLLDFDRPARSASEVDELLRRRIRRRLVTLASVIEKVEALAELPPNSPGRRS